MWPAHLHHFHTVLCLKSSPPPFLLSSILISFSFIISISSLPSSFSFLPSLSVCFSSAHLSAHITPAFSLKSALQYKGVCGFRVSVRTVVLHSAPCVKLSVHLSGFCGRSTALHREAGMEWRGEGGRGGCNMREKKAFRTAGKPHLGRNMIN